MAISRAARSLAAFFGLSVASLHAASSRADESTPLEATTPPDQASGASTAPSDEHEDMRFGVIGGVGFPHPIAVEGIVKISDWVAFGFEYGTLPKTNLGGVDVKLQSYAGDLRVYPFRGAFFVGVRGGYQTARASASVTVSDTTVQQTIDMTNWYVNPRIGILWTSRPGFTIGTEAGVQIPMAARTAASSSANGSPVDLPANPISTLNKSVLPTVDLVRIGWLF